MTRNAHKDSELPSLLENRDTHDQAQGHSGVHGVAEAELKVLIEQFASEGNSLHEHVQRHEAESFAVHKETLREHPRQLMRLRHVVEPAMHVFSAPRPRIWNNGKVLREGEKL